MEKLTPNTVDASLEKHLPVVSVKDGGITVNVGSVSHPMQSDHFIEWIYLHQINGGQRRLLFPDKPAQASLCAEEGEPLEVYAYCNLHGLWKTVL